MDLGSPLLYDVLLLPLEHLCIRRWRRVLWSRVEGSRVLEVGAGTGLNVDFYGNKRQVTALEKEDAALQRARRRAESRRMQVEFVKGNVEQLPFPNESFDTAVATFLFCSVRDPLQGMEELCRVLKAGGELLLLEHVRSGGMLGGIMDALSWPLYRFFGDHIARETDKALPRAGFVNVAVEPLLLDVVKLIRAEKAG